MAFWQTEQIWNHLLPTFTSSDMLTFLTNLCMNFFKIISFIKSIQKSSEEFKKWCVTIWTLLHLSWTPMNTTRRVRPNLKIFTEKSIKFLLIWSTFMMYFCSNTNSLFIALKILVRTFFKNSPFIFHQRKKVIYVQNVMRLSNFFFFFFWGASLTLTQSNRIHFLLSDQTWTAFNSYKCLTNTFTNTPRILC